MVAEANTKISCNHALNIEMPKDRPKETFMHLCHGPVGPHLFSFQVMACSFSLLFHQQRFPAQRSAVIHRCTCSCLPCIYSNKRERHEHHKTQNNPARNPPSAPFHPLGRRFQWRLFGGVGVVIGLALLISRYVHQCTREELDLPCPLNNHIV